MKVVVNGGTLNVPEVTGTAPYGFVSWGDESREEYASGLVHAYPGSGSYTLMMDLWNCEKITMTGIKGVTEIDLSKF